MDQIDLRPFANSAYYDILTDLKIRIELIV